MAKKVYSPSAKKVTAAVDWKGNLEEAWDELEHALGTSLFLNELFSYLPNSTIEDFIDTTVTNYDLDYVDDDDFPGRDF